MLQVVEPDPRLGVLSEFAPAAALGPVGSEMGLGTVALERGPAIIAHRRGQEMAMDMVGRPKTAP